MTADRQIRADFDRDTIVVYQAYSCAIADATLKAGRFVAPFSFHRMTWIKPSFLWLMHRSNWGQKRGQERVLAIRVSRSGWEKSLACAVLTSYETTVFESPEDWEQQFRSATVHVQWDTERSLRGAALPYSSIQVGISRHLIREYVDAWIVDIRDMTPCVRKMQRLLLAGKASEARRFLPRERVYPISRTLAQSLLMRDS